LFVDSGKPPIGMVSTTDVRAKNWRPVRENDSHDAQVRETDYFSAGRRHLFYTNMPNSQQARPEYVLLPDMPDIFWHGSLNNGYGWMDAGLAFFKFDHCARDRLLDPP
jgi:hypothetical protein